MYACAKTFYSLTVVSVANTLISNHHLFTHHTNDSVKFLVLWNVASWQMCWFEENSFSLNLQLIEPLSLQEIMFIFHRFICEMGVGMLQFRLRFDYLVVVMGLDRAWSTCTQCTPVNTQVELLIHSLDQVFQYKNQMVQHLVLDLWSGPPNQYRWYFLYEQ